MGEITILVDGSTVRCPLNPDAEQVMATLEKVLKLAGCRVGVNHIAGIVQASSGHLPEWQGRM